MSRRRDEKWRAAPRSAAVDRAALRAADSPIIKPFPVGSESGGLFAAGEGRCGHQSSFTHCRHGTRVQNSRPLAGTALGQSRNAAARPAGQPSTGSKNTQSGLSKHDQACMAAPLTGRVGAGHAPATPESADRRGGRAHLLNGRRRSRVEPRQIRSVRRVRPERRAGSPRVSKTGQLDALRWRRPRVRRERNYRGATQRELSRF